MLLSQYLYLVAFLCTTLIQAAPISSASASRPKGELLSSASSLVRRETPQDTSYKKTDTPLKASTRGRTPENPTQGPSRASQYIRNGKDRAHNALAEIRKKLKSAMDQIDKAAHRLGPEVRAKAKEALRRINVAVNKTDSQTPKSTGPASTSEKPT